MAALGLAIATVLAPASRAQLWDAALDLRLNEIAGGPGDLANPNSMVPQWSYGHRDAVASTSITLYSSAGSEHTDAFFGNEDLEGWFTPGNPFGATDILANTSGTLVPIGTSSVGTGELSIHPGFSGSRPYAVVRWTAPFDGFQEVYAQWRDLDAIAGDGFDAYLVKNGVTIFSDDVPSGDSTSYAGSISFLSGDVFDLIVGPGAALDYSFDTTAVVFRIGENALVPEGSTWLVGFVGIGAAFGWVNRLRRRRSP